MEPSSCSHLISRLGGGGHPTIATAEGDTCGGGLIRHKNKEWQVNIPSFAFVCSIGHLAGRCKLVHRATKVFLKHRSLLEEYGSFLYSNKPE